jgi:hypothetical protein
MLYHKEEDYKIDLYSAMPCKWISKYVNGLCWTAEVQFLAVKEIFLYSRASRLALEPTQPPVQ